MVASVCNPSAKEVGRQVGSLELSSSQFHPNGSSKSVSDPVSENKMDSSRGMTPEIDLWTL